MNSPFKQATQRSSIFLNRLGAIACLALMAMTAQASHFRGGQLNWTIPDPVNDPLTVEFILITTWDENDLCDFGGGVDLDFGDGNSTTLPCTLLTTGTDSTGSIYEMGESRVTHTYSAPGDYLAFHNGNARIGALQNSPNSPWRVESKVALGGGNTAAPQAILFTLNQMEIGGVQTLSFPMGDSDNDPLSCRFSTTAESSITTPQPTLGNTLSISSTNNLCTISWDTTGGNNGDLYAISIAVESVNNTKTSSLALDFILELVDSIPITNTISGSGNGVFMLAPGESVSTGITADHSAGDAMDFTLLGALPPNATLNPASGSNNPDPSVVTLDYTAGSAEQGTSYPMVFSFTDSGNLIRNSNIIIIVTPQDSDGDGILDKTDGIGVDTDGDGLENYLDLDSDNDGITDAEEGSIDTDGDAVPDRLDPDSDNDGIFDAIESGASPALDTDNDGRLDGAVGTNGLLDALETGADTGIVDYNGDGNPDAPADTDSNSVADFREPADSDGDGLDNTVDIDDDNDGITDVAEGTGDADGDGIPNHLDLDADNDGIPDLRESGADAATLDTDNDGRIDTAAFGVGANGLADIVETAADSGVTDYDSDSAADSPTDTDFDRTPDFLDIDADNDGLTDAVEAGGVDANGDGRNDNFSDSNNDGYADSLTATPLPVPDTDGDSVLDYRDHDSDNDGIPDSIEAGGTDTDSDGVIDAYQDSDQDGIPDVADVDQTGGTDGDGDGIDDIADVDLTNGSDANGNGIDDSIDPDSNGDGMANALQGSQGGSALPGPDTDGDGVRDFRDLDSDGDGIADLVEAGGVDADSDGKVDGFTDSNGDGLDDRLYTASGGTPLTVPDSDGNGIPDFQDNPDQGEVRTGLNAVGGCAVNPDARFDPLFPAMALLALLYLLRSRTVVSRRNRKWPAAVTAASLLAAGLPVSSQAQETADTHFYAGAGLGISHVEPDTDKSSFEVDDEADFGWKVFLGYDWNERFSIEGHYASLGEATLKPQGSVDYQVFGVSGLYRFYHHNGAEGFATREGLSWFGKMGIGKMENEGNDVDFKRENDVHLFFGIGAEYGLGSGFALRGDIDLYDKDAQLLSIDVLKRF